MIADLQAILESKRRYREYLAARPIAEKLRMLDAMCERALLLRPESSSAIHEEPATCRQADPTDDRYESKPTG